MEYVDRGDPANYDFTLGDFTTNEAWHDLDLSGIIPINAVGVFIICIIDGAIAEKGIRFRKKGNIYDRSMTYQLLQVGNQYIVGNFFVAVGNDGIIEYKVNNITWSVINFAVRGWII